MAGASAEETSLWQASGGPFTVRSPRRQSGVRVGLTGHVKFGMESPKICSTSPRHLLTPHSLSSSGAARIAMSVQSVLSIFRGHLPKVPQARYPVNPPDPVPDMLNLHGTPPSPKKCQRFVNLCRGGARRQTLDVSPPDAFLSYGQDSYVSISQPLRLHGPAGSLPRPSG